MPAESEAQRRYLNAHFGHDWVKRHHFDNAGPLPAHAHQEKPVSSILDSILGQSQGGSSAPAGGGLPPDLAAAIGGGGASPDGDPAGNEQGEVQLLSQIIDDIHQFMKVAADEDDKAIAATCLANFQKIRAKDQQEMDGASQGKTTPRMVRKAAAAQGGPGGPGY